MNDDRSLERAARSWLDDGPTRAPDRAVDAALQSIATTPPDREIWSQLRRNPMLGRMALPAAISAAVVIGALAYGQLKQNTEPGHTASFAVGGPRLDPSEDVGRVLPAATYYVTGAEFAALFSVTLPDGWTLSDLTTNHVRLQNTHDDGVQDLTLVVLNKVYTDPCDTAGGFRFAPHTANSLFTTLTSMTAFEAENIKDARIGAANGRSFTLVDSAALATAGCSGAKARWIGTYEYDQSETPSEVNLPLPGGSVRPMWVVDIDRTAVLIMAGVRDGSPANLEAAQRLIDSIWFMSYRADVPDAPAAASLDRRFSSSVNDVSVAYPAAWVVGPSTARGDPDWIDVGGARFTVRVLDVSLGQGVTMSDWLAHYGSGGTGDCAVRLPIRAGQADAVLLADNCPRSGGLSHLDTYSGAIAVANDDGYEFGFSTDSRNSTAWLKAFLETVEFPAK
jgi:hypothetical protein